MPLDLGGSDKGKLGKMDKAALLLAIANTVTKRFPNETAMAAAWKGGLALKDLSQLERLLVLSARCATFQEFQNSLHK